MPFVPVPETAQYRLQFTYLGQRCENVFHVRHQGPPDPTDMTSIGDVIVGWWRTILRPNVSNALRLDRLIAQSHHVANGPSVEVLAQAGDVGDQADPSMPSGVTLAVKWGTGLSGRSFRGRTYHMGLTEGMVTGNQVTATSREQIRAAYDALRTSLDNATLGVEFVVASRFHLGSPRATGVTTPISGVSVDPNIDFQRRRLQGRGQ